MNKVESAVFSFNNGFNCCQSVLLAYCQEFGLDSQVASRLSTGFGGGMGRMAGVCGAVTGAFMVLGLKYGKMRAEDNEPNKRPMNWLENLQKSSKLVMTQLPVKTYWDMTSALGKA